MSRRVIFPDPDFWTHPRAHKEARMTTDDNTLSAADYRRAAVLTLHHRQGNDPGLSVIVDETNAAGRSGHLLFAVLDLHESWIAQLRTADGVALLSSWVRNMSAVEASEPPAIDVTRAAAVLDAFGRKDEANIHDTLSAAADDQRLTEMFRALLNLYEAALPELSSEVGIRWVGDQVAALANHEVGEL